MRDKARKWIGRLGVILGLTAQFLYISHSIPTASAPLYIYYSPEMIRNAAMPADFPANCSVPVDEAWIAKVDDIRWVAYGTPGAVPGADSRQERADVILQDLTVLKNAGFTGLVTYGSTSIMGNEFLTMADDLGFQGVIMGIWKPSSPNELKNAVSAAAMPIVLGYVIGNEGMYTNNDRYSIEELCTAITDLRLHTGKPVATSEEIDDYAFHPELLFAGDWLFPNAHPFFHGMFDPLDAVRWQQGRYEDMAEGTGRFVLFKEVGLPTSGARPLSEVNQDLYYRELAKSDVRFVYFEGFDRPAKGNSSVEPYWGMFDSARAPKLLAQNLIGHQVFTSEGIYDGAITECSGVDNTGCIADISSPVMLVGDDESDLQYRGMLSFNTSLLPEDAVISGVRIKIRLDGHLGMDPFSKRRPLRVEACRSFGDSVKLEPGDFQTGENCVDAGTFTLNLEGNWFAADLDQLAFPLINAEGATQFRLWYDMSRGSNGKPDHVSIYSGDADAVDRPVLVLRYTIP